MQDDKGKRKIEVVAGAFAVVPPVPWHEFVNIGETTVAIPGRREEGPVGACCEPNPVSAPI